MHYFALETRTSRSNLLICKRVGWGMEKYVSAAWIVTFIGCFGAFLKMLPSLFETWLKHGGLLRRDLMNRIAKLETDVMAERQLCDEKLSRMQQRLDDITEVLVGMAQEPSGTLARELKKAFPVDSAWQDVFSRLNQIPYVAGEKG